MIKVILTIINVITALPILAWPFAIMMIPFLFDSPNTNKIFGYAVALALLLYPVFIVGLIILSRKYGSIIIALIAILPLLYMLDMFFVAGGSVQKENYLTQKKDFVCDSNSFLYKTEESDIQGLYLLKKKNFFTYTDERIATLYTDKWVRMDNYFRQKKGYAELLDTCKNSEGKSVNDLYSTADDSKVREILKSFR